MSATELYRALGLGGYADLDGWDLGTRMTFEAFIERELTRLTIQNFVETHGLSWNTVCEINLAGLNKMSRPGLKGLKRLAFDENHLGSRYRFVTVVLDLDRKAIASVLKGRGQTTLAPFFTKLKHAQAKIEAVATDIRCRQNGHPTQN